MLDCKEPVDELEEPEFRIVIKGKVLQAVGCDGIIDRTYDNKQDADTEFTHFLNHLVRAHFRVKPMETDHEEEKRVHRVLTNLLQPFLDEKGVLPPELIIPL